MTGSRNAGRPGVLLDLDGTLVDSVYQHVVAWRAALLDHGHDIPQHRIHAGIGMGSDRLVPWLLGGHVEHHGDLSDAHRKRFLALADQLRPTTGARALLDDLERRKVPFIVATSAGSTERRVLLDALGRDDLPVTDSDDVDSSKPAPDLLVASCHDAHIDPSRAVMVGDAPWDARAARAAGMAAVAVRCGGFGDKALLAAGAERIVDAPRDLIGQL